ncbi:hypothetical protein Theam_1139 [Thermovibrio ammonificans HB-1]|uniref:Citrate transporter-like domain-containing protein n=1 Tax=Thermovibrio ammonificans (strain DSM 15698 / JCM 12110 / HB-1) TaxID=648996 RepID=E8T2K8_THEA1|nr:SLC13 family permease [Thermovibrio ammonificans]ADU97103.1 hypothetical protein Theam_1139 [Thermovibrio ammonificans HB-1]
MRKIVEVVVAEWLFFLSLSALLVTSLVFHRLPRISPDELKVVFTLFVFLVILRSLELYGVISQVAAFFERGRWVGVKLVLLTALLSMFVTNDVALITVVPVTAAMALEGKAFLVTLEAVAANAGSALSPVGNPQNLFIYYHYDLHLKEFISAIGPFSLLLVPLFLLSLKVRSVCLEPPDPPLDGRWKVAVGLFLLFLPVALKLLPLYLAFVPLLYALLFDRRLFRVDYFLLGTFIAFFGFTDNLSHGLSLRLSSGASVFWSSVGLSQVMSNVPAALFVSEFTGRWKELLWGVNVGGFGTLVASLANLIAYRIYRERVEKGKRFLVLFHAVSFLFLLLGVLLFWALEGYNKGA